MKYLYSTVLSALLSLAAAAPLNTTNTGPGSPQATGVPKASDGYLLPSVTSQYEVWTGAVHYDVGEGKIFKSGRSTDVTTLLTFDVPSFAAPQTCEFHFYLDSGATVSGSGLFDVFDASAPATQDTTDWPQGNLRDHFGGRLRAEVGGEAVFQDGYGNDARAFPCPEPGKYGAELVGVYDVDDIEWDASVAGAWIRYYPQ